MNRVRWIVLACAMAATACSGESLTVGENDASSAITGDTGAPDAAPADTGAPDAGPADTGAPDAGSADTGVADVASTDAGPTDAGAPMDVAPADGDTADATPMDAGPADVPPTDLPPTDVAPADAPPDAAPTDVPADVRPPPTVGSLVVRLAGNPSNARVTVAGPMAFARTVETTTTFDGLAFGSYTVAAARTVLGGMSYVPTIVTSPVAVSADTPVDAPALVTVTYAPTNTPPTITAAGEVTLYASALTPTVVPFTVNDAEDGATGLAPTVSSSAPGTASARVVRDGTNWTLSLLPGSMAGSAMVTVSVTDSQGAVSTFAITVTVSTAGVVTTNANSGPGSLRAVISAVPAGATVTFAPSVVSPITLTSSIALPRSIILQGPGAGNLTIDGGGRVQLLYVTAPITVSGLTFNGGYSGSYGGAIQVAAPAMSFTLNDCAFTNNLADMMGGAVYVAGASTSTIARCTFTSNNSANGGAVALTSATNAVTDCTFRSNRATQHYGGALYSYITQRNTVEGCAFLSNSAANMGGAVALHSVIATMSINNSTFAGNSSVGHGGAVLLNGVGLSMSFCTVTGSTGGAALHIVPGGPMSLKNTIVAGNARDLSPFGNYQSGDYNIIGSVSGASFSGGDNDLVGETVALDPVSAYGGPTPTVRLPAGSIALDAIPAAACTSYTGAVSTDQRGRTRPAGARCDVGAFERQSGD